MRNWFTTRFLYRRDDMYGVVWAFVMSGYVHSVRFCTHRRGRTWGFLWSWAPSRCRPVLLWSTWPTAGSASGDGGSSAPEALSQTHPASCPLKKDGEKQKYWWIYTLFDSLSCSFVVYAAFIQLALHSSLQPQLSSILHAASHISPFVPYFQT